MTANSSPCTLGAIGDVIKRATVAIRLLTLDLVDVCLQPDLEKEPGFKHR